MRFYVELTGIEHGPAARRGLEKTAFVRLDLRLECTNERESQRLRARSLPSVHAPEVDELRAAFANVTRTLGSAPDHDEVLLLVRERAALRREPEPVAANSHDLRLARRVLTPLGF
jgi:hypothetical protein